MAAFKMIYTILLVLTISQSALGYTVIHDNGCDKVVKQVPHYALGAHSSKLSNLQYQVCAKVCSFWSCTTYYCPGDGICCTPGSPTSKCCPASHPLCLDNGCCPYEYPKVCGRYCCSKDSFCCNGENCCKNEKACCGERGEQQCCLEEAPCCKTGEKKSCCSKDDMACCDGGYGCVDPCESQFDAIGCLKLFTEKELEQLLLANLTQKETTGLAGKYLYRVLRPDEQVKIGLIAKGPSLQKSVLSHVNCGSRKNYQSQYISTTTSLAVAQDWVKRGEKQGLTNLRIAKIVLDKIPQECKIIDLTSEYTRKKYLGKAVCKNFAKKSKEVLLECNVPIPFKIVYPPHENVEKKSTYDEL